MKRIKVFRLLEEASSFLCSYIFVFLPPLTTLVDTALKIVVRHSLGNHEVVNFQTTSILQAVISQPSGSCHGSCETVFRQSSRVLRKP